VYFLEISHEIGYQIEDLKVGWLKISGLFFFWVSLTDPFENILERQSPNHPKTKVNKQLKQN
jgi:hypothetical protein